MSKEMLFEIFESMFPEWANKVSSYRKIGSRCLAIKFEEVLEDGTEEEYSRVFLWVDKDNWQFGTKLWRKRPERLNNKFAEQNNEEEDVQNEE